MTIPQSINLHFFAVPTVYIIIVLLILLSLYVIWYESQRDGFDIERVYNLFFILLIITFGTRYLINYNLPYVLFVRDYEQEIFLFATVFGSIFVLNGASRFWKWSVFRIYDIFSFSIFLFFTFLFGQSLLKDSSIENIVIFVLFVFFYLALFFYRQKIYSGIIFSYLLFLASTAGYFYFLKESHLIFYFILITISITNVIYRFRKIIMTTKFSTELLEKFRELLNTKKSRLKLEQQKLIEDDPYLGDDRSTGNSEEMDEAILEDLAKEQVEIKKKNIADMEAQVDTALDRMEKGTYGICEVCGNPIDKARLEIYPEATTCIDCSDK